MNPKIRSTLIGLEDEISPSLRMLDRMAERLGRAAKELPAELLDVRTAVVSCQESLAGLSARFDTLCVSERMLSAQSLDEALTDAEVGRLLALNRQLRDIMRHLLSVADDVVPRMKAKLADPNDLMYDYEIEAHIAYVLREDDPDFDEDEDSYLTERTEFLKHRYDYGARGDRLGGENAKPGSLWSEPHCWLFHDLYDRGYGIESQRLTFRDCLRIGRIFIDVQVWQQYDFNIS